MAEVSAAFGLEGRFLATPTSLQGAFGPPGAQHVALSRVAPGGIALGRFVALEGLVSRAGAGRLSPEQLRRALEKLPPNPWSPLASVLAAAGGGAAAAFAFGGTWADAAVASPAAAAAYVTSAVLSRRPDTAPLVSLLGAVVATTLSLLGAAGLGVSPAWPAVLGGIILLAPGYTLTLAATEVAAGELVAGTARLVAALSTFLQIALGMAAASAALGLWQGETLGATPMAPGEGGWLAAAAAGIAYGVLLQSARRDLAWVAAGAIAGQAAWVVADERVGGWFAPVLAAAMLSAGSELLSRQTGRPAALTLVSGILVLVPGGTGLGSLSFLLRDDIVPGVAAALATLMAAVALGTGVLVGSAAVGPRAR